MTMTLQKIMTNDIEKSRRDAARLAVAGERARQGRFTSSVSKNLAIDLHKHDAMLADEGRQRVEFGEIDTGERHGRVMVSHDQSADVITIHGVNVEMSNIDPDLRAAFRVASSAFGEAQDSVAQSDVRALVGLVVRGILERHDDFIGAKVRERQHHQRYGAV